MLNEIRTRFAEELDRATSVEDKLDRQDATKALEEKIVSEFAGDPESEGYAERRKAAELAFAVAEKEVIRQRIAVQKKRPDGRATDEIRPITIEVGVAPRTHGSALFTRGQTQALSVASMGTTREEMRLDDLGLKKQKYYWHHYNFPPFSVGEAGFMRGPKRRDIGHGALAERALVPVVPSIDEFPYTIRVVSDILESNGSSSMASVCGSTLALMDAGVPIKASVAGIAMGLIKEGDDYVVLSDIAGVEDHLGDMDFKVAGTKDGITALQMDIKITGVSFDILRDALEQAKSGREFILGKMAEVLPEPREELSEYAPRISSIKIDTDKIGMVIGKGGETIRALSEEFEAQIDMQEDGTVLIYAQTGARGDALVDRIRSMTKEVEVGDEFKGKVVKTTTFGAFVELTKGTDGLLHISNVSPGKRAETVEDVLNRGDEIDVRVVEVDKERGRIGLRLADDPEIAGKTAEELATVGTGDKGGERGGDRPRGRGGDRGGRGGERGGRGGRDRDGGNGDYRRDRR
jgi:polyribonucleotide nucleotidyltransferase